MSMSSGISSLESGFFDLDCYELRSQLTSRTPASGRSRRETEGEGEASEKSRKLTRPDSRTKIEKSSSKSYSKRALLGLSLLKLDKECICGRVKECNGVSSAFSLLKDARRGYVALPNLITNPQTLREHEQNNLRAAYLRHLSKQNTQLDLNKEQSEPVDATTRFVALHHFHPTVIEAHALTKKKGAPVPTPLKPVDIEYLQLKEDMTEDDRVKDEFGNVQNLYYCVPCYPLSKVKQDLKRAIRIKRMVAEAKQISVGTKETKSSRIISKSHASKTKPSAFLSAVPRTPPKAVPVDSVDLTLPPLESPKEALSPSEFIATETERPDSRVTPMTLESPPITDFEMPQPFALGGEKYPALLKFESVRKGNYVAELDEIIIRWKTTLDTMQGGILELARVERLLLGAVFASRAYGEAMQLIHEDAYVDDDGKVLTSTFAQTRAKRVRMEEDYSIDQDHINAQDDGIAKRSAMLHPLIESQALVANRFMNHEGSVKELVVPELTAFRRQLKSQSQDLKVIAEKCIREMKQAEYEVQACWSKFRSLVP
jgi:hypothetical protein